MENKEKMNSKSKFYLVGKILQIPFIIVMGCFIIFIIGLIGFVFWQVNFDPTFTQKESRIYLYASEILLLSVLLHLLGDFIQHPEKLKEKKRI